MFKKILCFFLAVSLAVCLVCPTAFADDATSEHTHDWVDLTPALKIEGKVHDLECSVSVKQCSICKFYDHKISLAGYTYDYIAATASPGFEGILQNLAMKLYASIFGNNSAATKAPSGIGRKDLPGYNDDNGTPTIGADGFPTLTFKMSLNGFSTNFGGTFLYGSPLGSYSNGTFSVSSTYNFTGFYATDNATAYPRGCVSYYFVAPYTGYYQVTDASCSVKIVSKDNGGYDFPDDNYASLVHVSAPFTGSNPSFPSRFYDSMKNGVSKNWQSNKVYIVKGKRYYLNFYLESYYSLSDSMSGHPAYYSVSINFPAPTITVTDIGSIATINKQTNITINNNIWNGNIYTDNSTNLTYIYPQYTTINENNETVTNISTNPIIYNNETKQYYTYDTVTNNYYYITYETSPTPTPSPSPAPAPTWTPGGGATRGGGVGRHPSDTDAADWTLHYYVLNNRRYDAYYALKKTEVDTDTKLPWVDNKKYISTTQIPIANGQYTVSVPDGVYWRVWSWDEASQTLTGVNSSNWHSTINNFLFNATGEYIFEFCKADGSDFNTAKDVTLKLKNDKITDYEDGGTIVEEPTPSPSPEPTETPSPTEPPIPTATPTPGGGTVPTPGGGTSGGNSGNGSNISGGDDEGLFGWLWDLLKDIVKAILKAIFKVLSGILGFLIWLVERVGLLFPFLPAPAVAALGAGIVLVFVIKIIRFIRG